jgi:hypothetical protein
LHCRMDMSADTTSVQEKQQREAQLRAALAGLSESEAEMDVNETEEEREARELREKQVLKLCLSFWGDVLSWRCLMCSDRKYACQK